MAHRYTQSHPFVEFLEVLGPIHYSQPTFLPKMSVVKQFIAFLTFCLFALSPKTMADDVRKMVLCKKEKEVRTIRVEKDLRDNVGWVTTYSKGGVDKINGECLNPVSCDDVLLRVQKSIEGVGWKCKEVHSAGIERISSAPQQ
jgi:hypothetical protein